MSANDALKVAVIGGGNIAQKHLPVLKDIAEAELASLVDANPQTLQESADRFGIANRWSSHHDLLAKDRPDAVFVMVSVLSMAEVAAEFIEAGVPTFLEKPPGLYTSDTRRLAALAEEHNTLAMVGVNRRFYSTMLEGRKRLLDEGPIRSITVEAHESIQRVRDNAAKWPEEVMRRWSAANGIHALDQLRFFAGDVASVDAQHHTVEGPMPDCCTAIIEFEQGAVGRALMDWFAPGAFRFDVRAVGATLTCVDGFDRLSFQRRGDDSELIEPDEIDRRYKAGFFLQDQTFIDCVRTGKPLPFPACTLDDAAKTMELVDPVAGTGDENDGAEGRGSGD